MRVSKWLYWKGILASAAMLMSGCGSPMSSPPVPNPPPIPSQFSIAVFGDSITAASAIAFSDAGDLIDPNSRLAQFNEIGWASGDNTPYEIGGQSFQVEGHFAKLKTLYDDVHLKVLAHGKPTQTSVQLIEQMDALGNQSADYATISIGGNDLCSLPGAIDLPNFLENKIPEIVSNLKNVLDRLILNNPKVKILVLAIPDYRQLYNVGVNATAAAIPGLTGETSCQERWDTLTICQGMLSSDRTEQERADMHEAQMKLNAAFQNLISEQYGNTVRFAEDIGTFAFTTEHVSRLDCYHPSALGQQKIADLSWFPDWLE